VHAHVRQAFRGCNAGQSWIDAGVAATARRVHFDEVVSATQQQASAAILAKDPTPRSQPALKLPTIALPERLEPRALAQLASLIERLIACLDGSPADALPAIVARCADQLESCLEVERERAAPPASAQDELRGLVAELVSEPPDTTRVMRRIRRVLSRIDARTAG